MDVTIKMFRQIKDCPISRWWKMSIICFTIFILIYWLRSYISNNLTTRYLTNTVVYWVKQTWSFSCIVTQSSCITSALIPGPTLFILALMTVFPLAADGEFGLYNMMQKNWKMTETLTCGYSYDSTQRDISNEYQHDRVYMFFLNCLYFSTMDENSLSMERVKLTSLTTWTSLTVMLYYLNLLIPHYRQLHPNTHTL